MTIAFCEPLRRGGEQATADSLQSVRAGLGCRMQGPPGAGQGTNLGSEQTRAMLSRRSCARSALQKAFSCPNALLHPR